MADIIVVAKANAAPVADARRVAEAARALNSSAVILRAASVLRIEDMAAVHGRRVLVVENGPTLTHGGMPHGAGYAGAIAWPGGDHCAIGGGGGRLRHAGRPGAPGRPILRVRYDFAELERPGLGERVDAFLRRQGLRYRPAAPR